MSLEPHWFSTIYGALYIIGFGLGAWALVILFACRDWEKDDALKERWGPRVLNDLGNLLLAFVMLWAYVELSQFLIIWSGNLPEETPWYLKRSSGGWRGIAIFLMVFHFFIPFFLLMRRENKRKAEILKKICLAILAMRVVDLYWKIAPAYGHDVHAGYHFRWTDPFAFLALGSIWFWTFTRELGKGGPPAPETEPPVQDGLQEAPAS
jgi:hypothetical protein